MEYLTDDQHIDGEYAKMRSVEKFLMEIIHPKLSPEKQASIKKYRDQGMSVFVSFELAGINTKMCKR